MPLLHFYYQLDGSMTVTRRMPSVSSMPALETTPGGGGGGGGRGAQRPTEHDDIRHVYIPSVTVTTTPIMNEWTSEPAWSFTGSMHAPYASPQRT